MAKYQKYAEYKDSGQDFLPLLPVHWDVSRVKKILNLRRFIVGNQSKFYQLLSLTLKGVIPRDISNGDGKIPESFDTYQAVKLDDLVFCLFDMDETPRTVGIAEQDGMITGAYNVYEVRQDNFPKYIYYYFLYLDQFKGLKPYYTGLRTVVRADTFANIKMPCPSLSEQTQIANFLDHETAKIDSLISKQEKLIELLKEKRQAVISHAVTKGLNPDVTMKDSGVEWLGQVPEHWAVAKLAYRYEVLLGKMLDESKITGNYLGKYLRNTDVQWGGINSENLPEMDFHPHEVERYSVKQGDLLVCEGGEIGRCAIWESEDTCFYQKALHRLRAYSDKDSHKFMFYILFDSVHRERFISGAGKATIAHLPAETFKQYRFAFPPKIEQDQIVEYLDKMSKAFDGIELKALE